MNKSWMEEMDTPVARIEPMAQTHFNKGEKPARVAGHCLKGRRSHSWVGGHCWWCGQPRRKR